jgi:hypothetical protein
MEGYMIGIDPIDKIIKCGLASGRIKNEKPLSEIIIGRIESGKTSMIRRRCQKRRTVFYTTDATAYGIIRDTNQLRDFSSGKLTHIVIPDLLACMSRKRDTVKTFILFMNALIEEGVVNISTYANNLRGNVEAKAGFITAITPDSFRDKRHNWGRIGFLSRSLPVSFDYKRETQNKIRRYIQKQLYLEEEIEKLKLPKKPKEIGLSYEIAKEIEPYALSLAAEHSEYQKVYGFRYQKQLQTFAKAIALLDGKDEVDDECIEELERLSEYINFDLNKI